MGKSRKIIDKLLADLKNTIKETEVVFEKYRELPEDLEPRQDIIKARIAIYNTAEDDVMRVSAEKPADSRQRYGIDISVVRGYRGDDAENHEMLALNIKDEIIDWIKVVDAFLVTEGSIHTFGYDGATDFVRRKRFATMTLQCSGIKDLLSLQSVVN